MEKEGIDKDYNERYEARTAEEATACFDTAINRLLNVNEWHLIAGKGTAVFLRMDKNGYALTGPVEQGDYLRIDILGPGSSKHFDWVQLERIVKDSSVVSFTVKPCDDPTQASNETAHFMSDAARSHFSVRREGNVITARIAGRNERPNTEGKNIITKARNILTGIGALVGASDIQWSKLVKGLVNFDH